MSNTFISKIQINEVRHIHDFEIPISETERKHLIITGKNGSGKTSSILELKKILSFVINKEYFTLQSTKDSISTFEKEIAKYENQEKTPDILNTIARNKNTLNSFYDKVKKYENLDVSFNNIADLVDKINNKKFIFKYFNATRVAQPRKPTGINKINLKDSYTIDDNANTDFLQYIINMKADRSFARDEGKLNEAQAIDTWFTNFENRLKFIFNAPSLKLEFDRQNYNFKIIEEGKESYDLTTLSDGYSAVMSIVTELILRMEGQNSNAYDIEGVVLIDEIETHLHVDLQKKILPFLTDFFPKVQFIVTTHSPFVINSISNAVVCDLEKRIVTEDLSAYSYEAVIESYFGSDMYSEEIIQKVTRYDGLLNKATLNDDEQLELFSLTNYFKSIPKFLSKELGAKVQEIELNHRLKLR